METNAPYIALIEDDVILAEGWMARTLDALKQLLLSPSSIRQTTTTHSTSKKPWLYLRLFYTETALAWQPDFDFWYAHMSLAFGLAMTVGLTMLLGVRRKWPATRARALDIPTVAVICLVTIPAFLALVFMIGKYSLSPLNGVVRMNKFGCCTQAMVYPRTQVPGLVTYLRKRNDGQTDSMIEEYADDNGLERFALAPQVVQHIGLYSSRDNTLVNTQSNWAFYFETNSPVKLEREHEKALAGGMKRWDVLRTPTDEGKKNS